MESTAFDEENCVLGPPKGVGHDRCESISVWKGPLENGTPVVISCWKLTKEELEEVNRTGRVWLMVWGESMPPVALKGVNPFNCLDLPPVDEPG
jgi:hypothetical protein